MAHKTGSPSTTPRTARSINGSVKVSSLCAAYVRENHPDVYAKFQQAVGQKKPAEDRAAKLMRDALGGNATTPPDAA